MRIAGDVQVTKRWIRERTRIYAKRVGLNYHPRVVFTDGEWRSCVSSDKRLIQQESKTLRGAASPDDGVIFVNLANQICRHDADETCAHETTHLRWPSLAHGDVFEGRVAALRRGVCFGPPGSRLPRGLDYSGRR